VAVLADLTRALESEAMDKPEFVYTTYINTTAEKLWQALTDPAFWSATFETDWQPERSPRRRAMHFVSNETSAASLSIESGVGRLGSLIRAPELALPPTPSRFLSESAEIGRRCSAHC
jgi:hypothetical protein